MMGFRLNGAGFSIEEVMKRKPIVVITYQTKESLSTPKEALRMLRKRAMCFMVIQFLRLRTFLAVNDFSNSTQKNADDLSVRSYIQGIYSNQISGYGK